MTSEVANSVAEAEKAMHGKVTGIIIPPPGIREIVDKTAEFVAKNGRAFEEKILTTKDKKFNFMRLNDPFHAYYEYKIKEFEEGAPKLVIPGAQQAQGAVEKRQEAATEKQQPAVEEGKAVAAAKASIKNPLAIFAKTKPEQPPQPYEFIFGQPVGLTPLGLDVLKLTAQFTAVNGREFLSALAQRELRNPQFDFLKPTHMLFSYFTALVDAYAKILNPDSARMEAIKKNTDRMTVLERVVHRWQFEKEEEEKRRQKEQQEDEEKAAFAKIDWNDFVVVETIDFPEDEFFDAGILPKQQADVEMEMDMDTDEIPVAPVRKAQPFVEEEPEEEIKVVSDYQPRVAAPTSKRPATVIDPVSGKAVPVDQIGEHMRIQLMDPKWREEQHRFQEKQKETSYAPGEAIAQHLAQFARRRGDIFGSAEEEEAMLRDEQERRRRRVDDGSHVPWDGHAASATAVQQAADAAAAHAPAPQLPPAGYGPAMPPPPPPPQPQAVPYPPQAGGGPPLPLAPTQYGFPPPPPPAAPFGAAPPPPPGPMGAPMPSGMHMPPPPPGMHMAPPPPGFPPATMGGMPPPPPPPVGAAQPESALVPEAEFAARYPHSITIRIQAPNDPSATEWSLHGQVVELNVNVTTTVKEVKEMLSQHIGGMPANRQQLRHAGGFLKDASTLAAYNIGDNAFLEMLGRSRGGRR